MSTPESALLGFAVLVLTTERLVAVVKTLLPTWLEDERKNAAGEVDLVADRPRRLRVQAVAFGAALVVARCLSGPAAAPAAGAGAPVLPLPLLALAACGAAAFWAQCIQRCSAAKDVAMTRRSVETLRFRRRAEERGAEPVDSGRAARATYPSTTDRRRRLLLQLHARAPEHLASPAPREP